MGILFMAFMVLSSLRYASYRAHEEEMERKRAEKLRAEMKKRGYVEGGTQTSNLEGSEFVAATAAEALAAS